MTPTRLALLGLAAAATLAAQPARAGAAPDLMAANHWNQLTPDASTFVPQFGLTLRVLGEASDASAALIGIGRNWRGGDRRPAFRRAEAGRASSTLERRRAPAASAAQGASRTPFISTNDRWGPTAPPSK